MIHHGDCLEVVAGMESESVDAIVTDPPYGLGFMGKEWDALPPGLPWAEQCLRVLRPGGHLVAFGGSRTIHRLVCAVEDAGFEIRDMLSWCFGSGFPKSHNLSGEWEGFGTALKPAWEGITLARKPFKGTVAGNVLEHGTGALNIDGCRVGTEGGTRKGSFPNQPSVSAYGDGLNGACEITPLDKGRWPANLILDEIAGAVLDGQSGEQKAGVAVRRNKGIVASSNVRYSGDDPTATEDVGYGDTGGASRFFYSAKTSRAERNAGLDGFEEQRRSTQYGAMGKRRCNVCGTKSAAPGAGGRWPNCEHDDWQWAKQEETGIKGGNAKNHHPTVKPIDLMRWLVRLVTPPGGIVLDPFTGSGSTGIAAHLEGMEFIGIEREAEYLAIAEARIAWWGDKHGDTADILVANGLAEKAKAEHVERGQLDLLGEAA